MTEATTELVVTVTIPRVPPSLANQRMWWSKRYRLLADWKQETWIRAHMARNELRLRSPHSFDPQRRVVITMHRCRQLDTDNAYSSVKGVLDGLVGVLVNDDSPRYCDLTVRQEKVAHLLDEKTVIEVFIPQPATGGDS